MHYSRQDLLDYQRLFQAWCDAQKAAHAALVAIVEEELAGKPVSQARRDEAARLDAESRGLMLATWNAAPPT